MRERNGLFGTKKFYFGALALALPIMLPVVLVLGIFTNIGPVMLFLIVKLLDV